MTEEVQSTQDLSGFDSVEALVNAYEKLKKDYDELAQNKTLQGGVSDWQDAISVFLDDYPEAKEYACEIGKILVENKEVRESKNPLERAYTLILSRRKTPEKMIEDEGFLDEYVYTSQKIKDKIISAYLAELNNNTPGVIGKGGETFITPPKSPKNLKEAMNLAEKLLNR